MLEPRSARPSPAWISSGARLPWSWAVERLERERNFWLVSARADGFPQARPVWGLWFGPGLFLSLARGGFHRTAAAGGATEMPVTVHADSASEVVIIEGIADRIRAAADGAPPTYDLDPDLHAKATESYKVKYDRDPQGPTQVNFLVRPLRVYSWSENEERNGGDTGTRWDFDES